MSQTKPTMGANDDEELFNKILTSGEVPADLGLGNIWDRQLDQTDKADDARDFEDISDDDLADEEEEAPPQRANISSAVEDDDDLDLFGDEGAGPELEDQHTSISARDFDYAKAREMNGLPPLDENDFPPAPPENDEEAFAAMWPTFRQDFVPRFQDLFPPKPAQYVGKQPLKAPKALHITKVTLDLAQDQSKLFRAPDAATSIRPDFYLDFERKGLVPVIEPRVESDNESDIALDEIDPNEMIGAVRWRDLQVICDDWDVDVIEKKFESEDAQGRTTSVQDDLFGDDWDQDIDTPPPKRQKTSNFGAEFFSKPVFDLSCIDNPEEAAAKFGRRVIIDLNDPKLLVETVAPEIEEHRRAAEAEQRVADGNEAVKALKRFNISNDEAYDQLKENHQSKVRSTLATLAVEHSMPAIKLQYPFYKVELDTKEARSFHRPTIEFLSNMHIVFDKPKTMKRKYIKGKDVKTLFATADDLTLADNANVVLLEYSEEYPTTMSNFGMGNRIINYYRKQNSEDVSRPKMDIGELQVLFPHDRSPFANFGTVDPGEVVPTLHNSMYRAPIFKQQAKSTDFLVIRSETGVHGKKYFIRNIDHLYVVGQELPVVDVPGPHARKVTTAQKNRMKMLAFRLANKSKYETVDMQHVTKHIRDSTDMQNRQKMKEFMKYNKDFKQWGMKPGESLPNENSIRAMVKPEDVCLIESMQVGKRHLQDSGFGKDVDELEDDDSKEEDSLEKQLAPWNTTRNFLNATQGKAMLQLHGEGDPSGRGEAFSLLKTSMKGGFKALGESVEDKLDAKKQETDGGHKYNVAKQAKAYEDAIKRIWEGQKTSLSSQLENSDIDMDDIDDDEAEGGLEAGMTPRSEAQTPGYRFRADDETGSQFSKLSNVSQRGKVLRIRRVKKHANGQREDVEDIVRNPAVIRQYLKRRHAMEAMNIRLDDIKPTGDAEQDRRNQKRLAEELARLERNKDRRVARDKQKGLITDDSLAGSPGSPSSPSNTNPKATGTTRKCANCGQVGHIKTNKKLCPMLNGTMKPDAAFKDAGFGSMPPPGPPPALL